MAKEITGDEFHEILKKVVEEMVTVDELLSTEGIYEILSEEFNNEVLQAWEEGTFDLDEKLFSFTINEINGEREYSINCLVKAKNNEEANERATKYGSEYYYDDPTYRYDETEGVHYFDNECIKVAVEGLIEISLEAWLEQAYDSALIPNV